LDRERNFSSSIAPHFLGNNCYNRIEARVLFFCSLNYPRTIQVAIETIKSEKLLHFYKKGYKKRAERTDSVGERSMFYIDFLSFSPAIW